MNNREMTLIFYWKRPIDLYARLQNSLHPEKTQNVLLSGTGYYKTNSNFCSTPFQSTLIYQSTVIKKGVIEKFDETVTFTVTDNEKNIIGSVSASGIYSNKIDKNDMNRTTLNTVSFPIITGTGIFIPYIGGYIQVEYNEDGSRKAYLFKL
jgi:hypothetical protein